MLKFYCNECERNVQVQNLSCKKDDRHGRIWGELCCIECHHILLTFTSDEEGELGIKSEPSDFAEGLKYANPGD